MNEEQLHKWLEDYEAGLEISSASRLSKRKKEAMEYADTDFPEALSLRKAMAVAVTGHRSPATLEEMMGFRLVQGTSLIVRRFMEKYPEFRRARKVEAVPVPPQVETRAPIISNTHRNSTIVEVYLKWLYENDEVPADKILAHFLNCTTGALGSARKEAKKMGYHFEHTKGGGWRVIQRPSQKVIRTFKQEEEISPELVAKVIKAILKAR